MKLRLIELVLVELGLINPVVKGIADAIRDNPETFIRKAGRDKTFSWLTHTSRQFSVMRFDDETKLLPNFRIVNRRGNEVFTLSWFDRLVLALAWPDELLPIYRTFNASHLYYAHD
ncbi:MAG: hypothetical protein M3O74_13600 [Pseudomonadota bacterium]|nr:hypothetical protein [Pseudomonadota bacterium]